jgi:hypothetical protein
MVEVIATDEFRSWYDDLDDAAADDVEVARCVSSTPSTPSAKPCF